MNTVLQTFFHKSIASNINSFRFQAWPEDYINLPESFCAYTKMLNPKFNREILRQERRLKERGEVKYEFKNRDFSVKDSINDFLSLENSGWKGKRKSSIVSDPGDHSLFSNAAFHFYKYGLLQMNFLLLGDLKIAAQYAVKINKVLYIWKIGYDECFSKCAPGNLLMYRTIEHSILQGDISEINFMNERGWLKVWKISSRQLMHVSIFPTKFPYSTFLRYFYLLKYKKLS
jgi:hypothetical protein